MTLSVVDGSAIAYWEDMSGTKHYYYTGKEGEGCSCGLVTKDCAGGFDAKCHCDMNDDTLRSVKSVDLDTPFWGKNSQCV